MRPRQTFGIRLSFKSNDAPTTACSGCGKLLRATSPSSASAPVEQGPGWSHKLLRNFCVCFASDLSTIPHCEKCASRFAFGDSQRTQRVYLATAFSADIKQGLSQKSRVRSQDSAVAGYLSLRNLI